MSSGEIVAGKRAGMKALPHILRECPARSTTKSAVFNTKGFLIRGFLFCNAVSPSRYSSKYDPKRRGRSGAPVPLHATANTMPFDDTYSLIVIPATVMVSIEYP